MTLRVRLPVIIVCALWGAVYLPPLLAGRTLPARDVAATQIPWRTVWREQVAAGRLPLWDPLSNHGRPLLANPNAMAAYPGTLLFLALPPETAAAWQIATHHLLLLLGCYALARRSGAAPGAAAVAAAATGAGGIAWSTTTLLNTQASLAWSVWALATAVPPPAGRALPRRALAGGALLGLALLAGEPVVAALAALAWAVVVTAGWRPRALPALGIAAAAAAGIAAPVLVPLLVVWPDTVRGFLGVAPGALAADTLAPRRFLELFLPHLLGAPLGDRDGGFWAAASFPWQRYYPLIFVGSFTLLALAFARRGGRRLAPWWALLLLGAGGSAALAIPGVAALAERLPGAGGVRYGIKLLLLVALALPPLVAFGCERLATAAPRRRRLAAGLVLAVAALVALAGAVRPDGVRRWLARLYSRSASAATALDDAAVRRALAVDAAALALPAAALLVTVSPAALAAAALGGNLLAAEELIAFDASARWSVPPALAAELPPETRVVALAEAALDEAPGGGALRRFRRARAALVPQYGVRWGIGYALSRGPDGLEPIRAELLAAEAAHLPLAQRARVAGALAAGAVIGDEAIAGLPSRRVAGVWLTMLPDRAPDAYLAHRLLPCEGIPAAVRALASEGFRAGADAVVDGGGGAVALAGGRADDLGGPPHRRRFAVTTDGPGFLVVQQSLMRCWRAAIDGRPAAVEAANGAMIGVRVPSGAHTVELYVGQAPVWLGALGPLLLLVAFWLRARKETTSPDSSVRGGPSPSPRPRSKFADFTPPSDSPGGESP